MELLGMAPIHGEAIAMQSLVKRHVITMWITPMYNLLIVRWVLRLCCITCPSIFCCSLAVHLTLLSSSLNYWYFIDWPSTPQPQVSNDSYFFVLVDTFDLFLLFTDTAYLTLLIFILFHFHVGALFLLFTTECCPQQGCYPKLYAYMGWTADCCCSKSCRWWSNYNQSHWMYR